MILHCTTCRRKIDVLAKDFDFVSEFAACFGTVGRFYCQNCRPIKAAPCEAPLVEQGNHQTGMAVNNENDANPSAVEAFVSNPAVTPERERTVVSGQSAEDHRLPFGGEPITFHTNIDIQSEIEAKFQKKIRRKSTGKPTKKATERVYP
jgi:hypothetical protein